MLLHYSTFPTTYVIVGRPLRLNAKARCFLFEDDLTSIPAAAIFLFAFRLNCTFALLSSMSANVGCES